MSSSLLYITSTIPPFLGWLSISLEIPSNLNLALLTHRQNTTVFTHQNVQKYVVVKKLFQIFDLGWISPLSLTMTNHSEAQVGNFVNFELN